MAVRAVRDSCYFYLALGAALRSANPSPLAVWGQTPIVEGHAVWIGKSYDISLRNTR